MGERYGRASEQCRIASLAPVHAAYCDHLCRLSAWQAGSQGLVSLLPAFPMQLVDKISRRRGREKGLGAHLFICKRHAAARCGRRLPRRGARCPCGNPAPWGGLRGSMGPARSLGGRQSVHAAITAASSLKPLHGLSLYAGSTDRRALHTPPLSSQASPPPRDSRPSCPRPPAAAGRAARCPCRARPGMLAPALGSWRRRQCPPPAPSARVA